MSDDIESFVHVFHYCVLRFHETSNKCSLAEVVKSTFEEMEKRAEDGAYVGGLTKFYQMCNSTPPIFPIDNATLKGMLDELADLCAAHYATIDTKEYDRLYNPAPQPSISAPQHETVPAAPRAHSTNARIRQLMKTNPKQPRPDAKSPTRPFPTFGDHKKLREFFYQWVAWVEWPAGDLVKSPEDLFKKAHLAPSKDNAFGSSQNESLLLRASKRSKQNDGTALASVSEDVERMH